MSSSERTITNILLPAEGLALSPCLVMIRGPQLGRCIPLDRPEIALGRSSTSDIVLGLEGVSRTHCRLIVRDGRVAVRDEGSKNGTWLRGERLTAAQERTLQNGDVIHICDASFKYLNSQDAEAEYHEAVYRMMTEDALTQVKNRRFLTDLLDREVSRELRTPHGLALLLADVDEFKRINDECGHVFGDHVLRHVAAAISRSMRRADCLARYGGDEFAVVLNETTRAGAEIFAERLRGQVEHERFEVDGVARQVTVSIGVAFFTSEVATPAAFLSAADVALYAAKGAGRNRVAS